MIITDEEQRTESNSGFKTMQNTFNMTYDMTQAICCLGVLILLLIAWTNIVLSVNEIWDL